MKRAIEIIASEETFANLATFETIEQLNETVRAYKRQFADQLNKTELAVLDVLHRYSAKYTGVSFLRKSKIGELIGKSRRTIIRVCKRLEALGIIRQYEMKRPSDMQQTSNAIVIQPVPKIPKEFSNDNTLSIMTDDTVENVTQEVNGNVTPRKSSISLKQIHTSKERTERPFKHKLAWIPENFYKLLAAHFNSIDEIEEYWRAVHAITYSYDLAKETKEDIGIQAFMEMKARRHKLHKPIAYFVGIVKRKAKQRYITELFNSVMAI
ncbi:helix-turn-helix domain-containing protein (plasmid) [Bacillus methanolicus]|uniref:helix-turn-helix domain-containing protein n=1 Tax=Bacillus methanolicus TaxID=1471 RepID=UPI00200CE09B|nr:helix-turn-helix domain-containing protein [Bacillus methanolicus]UQD53886.1 helix-turn-helix domain-containing protein [Bacillus methanolicus]